MNLRALVLTALPAFCASAFAQQAPLPPAPQPAPATQDPDRMRKTPEQRKAELEAEMRRLSDEIEFVRTRALDSAKLLREKLARRGLEVKSIDAGSGNVVAPVAEPRRAVRILKPEEAKALGDDVWLTVEGRPIRKGDVKELVTYLETTPYSGDESQRSMRAMLELIRLHSTIAAFPDAVDEARQKIDAAAEELKKGTDFGEVARRYSSGPNIDKDGRVQITQNCQFGLFVERAVFAAKEGEVTAPQRGLTGFCIVQVEKHGKQGLEDAPTPISDCKIIVVPYHADPAEVEQARARAMMGQVDIAARDDQVVAMLPPILRPLPANDATSDVPPKTEPKKELPKQEGKL